MDVAFYTEENLTELNSSINWISRVALTIKAAQEITQSILAEQLDKSAKYKGYSFCNVCSEYAGVKQEFACEADAITAGNDFNKTLKYHLLNDLEVVSKPHYKRKGKPCKNQTRWACDQ